MIKWPQVLPLQCHGIFLFNQRDFKSFNKVLFTTIMFNEPIMNKCDKQCEMKCNHFKISALSLYRRWSLFLFVNVIQVTFGGVGGDPSFLKHFKNGHMLQLYVMEDKCATNINGLFL